MPGVIHHNKFLFGSLSALFLLTVAIGAYTGYYLVAFIPFVILLTWFAWQHLPGLFLLLMASLPLSIEFNFSETLGTDLPDEPLMILVAAGALWYILPDKLNGRNEFRCIVSHPIILLLLAGLLWTLVSASFSTHPIISIKYLLAKGWYLMAFIVAPLLLFTSKERIKSAGGVILASMLLVTLIILIRHASFGFYFAYVNDAIRPFFRNHVNYSAMLVCLLPAGILCWRMQVTRRGKTMLMLAIAIAIAALFLSFARGAWLAAIIGLISYVLIRKRMLFQSYLVGWLLLIIAAFWMGSGERYLKYAHDYRTTIFHQNFQQHLVATYQLKDLSTAERFNRWIAAIRMTDEDRLTGFGPATFYSNYKPYTIPAFKTWVSDNPEHSTVHNYFLLLLVEQGFTGCILFLLLTAALFYYAQRIYHRDSDPFYRRLAMMAGCTVAMILTVNFLSDLIETDKLGSLFFLFISLLVIADIRTRASDSATNV